MDAPRALRLGWLFWALALLGLASFVSMWGMIAVVRFADIEVRHSLDPEPGGMPESWFWAWVVVGWLGLAVFLLSGMFALLARGNRPSARDRRD